MVWSSHFGVWQVNIPWEDILQEEPNKGIFTIELGECNEDDEYTIVHDLPAYVFHIFFSKFLVET